MVNGISTAEDTLLFYVHHSFLILKIIIWLVIVSWQKSLPAPLDLCNICQNFYTVILYQNNKIYY